MTLRDCAIQAMKELGYSEARIASILNYMDTDNPNLIGQTHAELPPEWELETIELAKDYFRNNNTIPTDN